MSLMRKPFGSNEWGHELFAIATSWLESCGPDTEPNLVLIVAYPQRICQASVSCESLTLSIKNTGWYKLRFQEHAEAMKADMGQPEMSNVDLHERLQANLGRMDTQEAGVRLCVRFAGLSDLFRFVLRTCAAGGCQTFLPMGGALAQHGSFLDFLEGHN